MQNRRYSETDESLLGGHGHVSLDLVDDSNIFEDVDNVDSGEHHHAHHRRLVVLAVLSL